MTEIIIKSDNKKAIKAIKNLAEAFDMEVSEPSEASKIPGEKRSWDELIKAGIVVPGNKSGKLTDIAGKWVGKELDAKKLRQKAWTRQK